MEKKVKSAARAFIEPSKCVGCGACIGKCPAGAITLLPILKSQVDQDKCIGCGVCARLCHRQAPALIVI